MFNSILFISNINLDEADIVMLSQNIEKYLPEYNKILKLVHLYHGFHISYF